MNGLNQLRLIEYRMHRYLAENCILMTRVSMGIIFFWFGVLKFFPGMSPAEDVAARTITYLTFGLVSPAISIPVLAMWECCIGLGFITGLFKRGTLLLLALQLPGTFLPLLFFPHETFAHFPVVPTLEGQYIIKNLVLASAGLLMAASISGGKVVVDPLKIEEEQTIDLRERFRLRLPEISRVSFL